MITTYLDADTSAREAQRAQRGLALLGLALRCKVWRGGAWRGLARQGAARRCMARQGKAWRGRAWQRVALRGMETVGRAVPFAGDGPLRLGEV